MNLRALLFTALLLAAPPALAQQQASDPDFRPEIARPAYPAGRGPVVAIDESHANFHTIAGRYAPFAALLGGDGYRVQPVAALDGEALKGVAVLVIANARRPLDAAEIDAIASWVAGGGALLLIADHAPFGRAAAALSQRFGVDMGQGYVVTGEQPIAASRGRSSSAARGSPIIRR